MLGDRGGAGPGRGERGAMRPSDISLRDGLSRTRGNSTERLLKRDLKSEPREGLVVIDGPIGLSVSLTIAADMGSALSFALRLRKRNKGASHTHMPKNVAISLNPGMFLVVGGRYDLWLACLAFSVKLAK